MIATIRPATLWDLYAIEYLGRRGLEEAGQLYPVYDLGHMLKGFIDSIERAMVYVAEVEHEEIDADARSATHGKMIIGALVMGVTCWPQAPRVQMMTNEHLYVLPEHRSATVDGVSVGRALINIMTSIADKGNVPILFNGTFGKDVEVMRRLMERSGFQAIGHTFMYQPVKATAKADEAA